MPSSRRVNDWEVFPLWKHQVEAIQMVLKYSVHFSEIQKKLIDYEKSALVRMPTGTGKSGVIAVIARCINELDRVLVISPWVALRDQIKRDIEFRFWEKLGIDIPNKDKVIIELLPSNSEHVIEKISNKSGIIVATIQTIQTIFRDQPTTYSDLKNLLSIIIVDEGHREPAPEWAKAIRNFKLPIVLFTATPYRNDHKMFNVDENYTYYLSHKDAVEKKFIREVEFVEKKFANRDEFVDILLDYFHGDFQSIKPSLIDQPRVIIRCENSDEINAIAKILQSKGETVVAVHERFADTDDDYLSKKVPNPDTDTSVFWIHQHKLVEGIDDPRFSLLAIFKPFRNARALVQQVGRVVRNPSQIADQKAFVLSHPTDRQKGYWHGYLKYEELFNSNPDKFEPRQLFDNIINLQPLYQIGYIDKDFRERFDFEINEGQIHQHLAYARSTSIYSLSNEYSVDDLVLSILKEWNNLDKDVRKFEKPDENTYVLIYQIFNNSPVLIHHALLEFRIGFTIIRKSGNYLFYYDSEGDNSSSVSEFAIKIPPSKLENLFQGKNTRLNQISLINCDLGKHSIRRRVVQAYSIEDTAPSLSDYSHFYSTAYGYTTRLDKNYTRRYVGFTRSRVTDSSGFRIEYSAYIDWLESISKELDRVGGSALTFLSRFALPTNPPNDPSPNNILLDLDGVESSFIEISTDDDKERNTLLIDEKCHAIENGKFSCIINSTLYEISISYDKGRRRYNLKSPQLETSFAKLNPGNGEKEEGLLSFINRTQAFRVVTSGGIVYAHEYFFEPRLKIWGPNRKDYFALSRIFYTSTALSIIGSEKGTKSLPDESGWQSDSLFNYIDHIGEVDGLAPQESFDILVCDDMNNEIADFIAVSTQEKKIVFIHAKANKRSAPFSASKFHDACSQAVKNLGGLSPFMNYQPPNMKNWDNPWTSPATTQGNVKHKIRRGTGDAYSIWEKIKDILNDPSSIKEVWLVFGQGLSLQNLENERIKENPAPELIQILFLLQSTWGAVSSIGASLRIYCSP